MVWSEAVGLGVADGKKSQVPLGRDQRNAQPGAQMCMSLEGLPRFFLPGICNQDTSLSSQDALQERRVVGIECQRAFRTGLWSFVAESLSQRQHMGTAFRDQDPSAGVRY